MIRRVTIQDRESDFLLVDHFLQRLMPARSLRTAFDIGIIDQLACMGLATSQQLATHSSLDLTAVDLLFTGLVAADVAEYLPECDDAWQLTTRFRRALRYRDLLETKLDLALSVVVDLADRYELLLTDPDTFFRTAHKACSQVGILARCPKPSSDRRVALRDLVFI